MAKRMTLFAPFFGVRNIYVVVLLPKSNTRDQALTLVCFTQAVMLKSVRVAQTPAGKETYWLLLLLKFTALLLYPAAHVGLFTKIPSQPLPVESNASCR